MNSRPQSGRENTLTRFPAGSRNIERAMFRMLGIRPYLLLRRVDS